MIDDEFSGNVSVSDERGPFDGGDHETMPGEDTRAADATSLYEFARNGDELTLVEYLLDAEKPLIRRRAAELLGGLATRTQPTLEERTGRALLRAAKTDESDAVRAAAIDALYLRDEERLESLIDEIAAGGIHGAPEWMRGARPVDWLRAEYAEFRLVAAAALGQFGEGGVGDEVGGGSDFGEVGGGGDFDKAGSESNPTAIAALVDCCTDPDVRVRTRAVRSCGEIGDPRSIAAVASRLDDTHEQVRRAAARALAAIGTDEALTALESATQSDTEAVRLIAFGALDSARTLDSLPLLVEGLSDDADAVRRTATRSVLKLIASAPPERSHEVRTRVLEAIEAAEPTDLETQLLTILGGNQPRTVRRNATWLLGTVADAETNRLEDVQAFLIDALDDPDDVTAKFAMSALIELPGEGLESRLRQRIKSDGGSSTARARMEFVLEKGRTGPSRDVVTNAVEYTVVSDPADYTAKKRQEQTDARD